MLRLERLTKRWEARAHDDRPVVAVDDVSLDVPQGEFLTLLGPSGCGKTTTLRLIAGFESPSSGRILLEDRDVTPLSPQRRGVGMVFQNYALFPHLDVFENVAFGLKARGDARSEIERRVERALQLVDLPGYAASKVQELSGGQQQRVALARALAPEPPLLLLDEPLSNLDAALRERTRSELRALLKKLGITVVFVTHDQEEAFALSDRVAVMSAGRIQQVGRPEALYHRPANTFVASFLGRANFLSAAVRSVDGQEVLCELPGGALWRARPAASLTDDQGTPRVEPGDAVRVMIRPESLTLDGAGAPDSLEARLVERRFAGATTEYRLRVAGAEILAWSRGGPEAGALSIRPADDASILVFAAS